MIKKIQVEGFLRYLGEGISKPSVILGDDHQRYILKTQKVIKNGKSVLYDCVFLNELLSYQIAKYLNIPIPEAAIAYVDKVLIQNDPSIVFVHRFSEGLHFASLELPREDNLINNFIELIRMKKPYIVRSWNAYFDNIINTNDIAKIISFDLLISNFDRYSNTGNLIVANSDKGRKLFTIDHGHAFWGPVWNTDKITQLKTPENSIQYVDWYVNYILNLNACQGFVNGLGEVFRAIELKLDLSNVADHPFQDVIENIELISEETIDNWMSEIPIEWYVDKDIQIGYYKYYILKQKSIIRYIIQRLAERKAFTNFRGGELKWKTEKQFGTA